MIKWLAILFHFLKCFLDPLTARLERLEILLDDKSNVLSLAGTALRF